MSSIVVVEDSKSVLQFLIHKIESEGHTVIGFSKPLEALKQIPEMNPMPDLIISDYVMYDMDGIVLIENLRKLNLNTKYILLSSFRDEEIIKECFDRSIELFNKTSDLELLMRFLKCL